MNDKTIQDIDLLAPNMAGKMIIKINKNGNPFFTICEIGVESIEKATASSKELKKATCIAYPNGRVKHLALNHRKARVRKKNYRRILKWLVNRV